MFGNYGGFSYLCIVKLKNKANMAYPRTLSGIRRFEGIINLKLMMGLPLSDEQKEYIESVVSKEEIEKKAYEDNNNSKRLCHRDEQ